MDNTSPFHTFNNSDYNIVTSFDDALSNYLNTEVTQETTLDFYNKHIVLPSDAYFNSMPGVALCKRSSILIYTTDSGC